MQERNIKFINLLKMMNIELTDSLENGKVEYININRKLFSIEIAYSFAKVLDIDVISNVIEATKKHFSDIYDFRNIDVRIIYKDNTLTNDLLKKYFTNIVDIFARQKSRFKVLNSFNYELRNNDVIIFVANNEEVKIIDELLNPIRMVFNQFGLSGQIKVEISKFETPIKKIIEKNIEATTAELIRDQVNYEKSFKEPKPEKAKKGKRLPRIKEGLNKPVTPLRKIPASEIQLIEYMQQYGKSDFTILGEVIQSSVKEFSRRDDPSSKFKIYEALITDGEDSIKIKTFINRDTNEEYYEKEAVKGQIVRVSGRANYDKFARDVVLTIFDIRVEGKSQKEERTDDASEKRVELHAHTKMSVQDSVMDVNDYVKQAVKFKHRALAVTDMYNIHIWPDFYNATKDLDIIPIFGLEGAFIDEEKFKIALSDDDIDLKNATYVVYDLETTGLSSIYHEIIEIAAAKINNGLVIDEFSAYVKPKEKITEFITSLTSITNDDVRNAESIEEVLPKFKEFIGDAILVAHNATFDNSHLYENMKRLNIYEGIIPTIDTLQLAKVRYGHKLKRFNLKSVSKYFSVELEQHHRAIYDAKATANVFIHMLNDFIEDGIINYSQINDCIDDEELYKLAYPSHITMLAMNKIGKKNIYKIVSDSHTVHFSKEPRILKKFLNTHREGVLIGSGCVNGEVFTTAFEKGDDELRKVIAFYDYIEVQPLSVYEVLVEKNKDKKLRKHLIDIVKRIINIAKECGKLVVATGDVHHLTKEDKKLRQIYIDAPQIGGGIHNLASLENVPSFHYMTTNEMLDEFSFLDSRLAYEIVVTNSNLIADRIERFELFPDKLFAPADDFMKDRGVPSFKEGVINMTYTNAKVIYGNDVPQYIVNRIKKELDSIIGNNFASIYYISHLLVKHSQDAGYVVGSRGSVGSSLVAFLMRITEVNPLPPHYVCPNCHFTAIKYTEEEKKIYPRSKEETSFDEVLQKAGTGYDLEPCTCPHCGTEMNQEGVDIPFETFLGFKGDKVPDIDLNFSGEYQGRAHEFCRELFGDDHAFRAGTILTIAEKTAFGYVKKYYEKKGIQVRNAEIERLIKKVQGVKRSTSQHPGGIVVVPHEIEYADIIPIQYPADDTSSAWRTTHYDYHKFESNLLKLDILGHDDPTMIRHLMNFVEAYPNEFPFSKVEEIPLNDKNVFEVFSGLKSLNITSKQICGETIGTTGLPEFGTALTKAMLSEIRPTTVDELLKVSGLSHGTGVWNGNAREFMLGAKEGYPEIRFKDLIGCRDDIMVYLISQGLPANDAFKIMESVRKGRGVSKNYEKEMLSYNVPKWYIESCKLIEYMFPKAHATAYVIMALRIGWFKVHRPIFYYSAYFSRRATAFDVVSMARGYDAIKTKYLQLDKKIENKAATSKEIDTHYTLLLALEMTARGYSFSQIDIFNSDATNFKVSKDRKKLLIPFSAMDSLGDATAKSIIKARNKKQFTSKQDVLRRTKLNTTLFEKLDALGCFKNLPETDQIGLF